MFTVFSVYIYFNPFYAIELQFWLHGVPSAWVFVSGMLAEA